MPNHPTDKKGFPCRPGECKWPMRHLAPNEFKMYSLGMAFAAEGEKSRGDGQYRLTAAICPTICNAYPCSRNNADKLIERLCDLGWWIRHEGGRDSRTGHLKPNAYEIVQHHDFIVRHPDSCPPKEYIDDYETAQALGLNYGDRFERESVPENFQKFISTPLGQAIGEWLSTLTDDDRVALLEHYKNLQFAPEDPEKLEQLRKQNAEVRKLITTHTNVGLDCSHERGTGPLPQTSDDPLPQTSDHHSHKRGRNLRRFKLRKFRLRKTTTDNPWQRDPIAAIETPSVVVVVVAIC
jgi:hypothetical protein